MLDLRRQFVKYSFSFSSETQKLRWLNEHPLIDDAFLSLAVNSKDHNITRDVFEMVIKGKGAVVDALCAERETAQCKPDSTIINILEMREDVYEKIGHLTVVSIIKGIETRIRDSMEILYRAQDSLESLLSRKCSEYDKALEKWGFSIQDIANTLQSDEIVCEFVRYRPYDFSGTGTEENRIGSERYLVFTLDNGGHTELYDLGSADTIDNLIKSVREMIYEASTLVYSPMAAELENQLGYLTQQLFNMLFEPLTSDLTNRHEIIVCPDGMLNVLPLGILRTPAGSYFIENYKISYIATARDLLSFQQVERIFTQAMIMGDPDYDCTLVSNKQAIANERDQTILQMEENPIMFRSMPSCLNIGFSPLHNSRIESMKIATALRTADQMTINEYYDSDATEFTMKNLTSPPCVLHLATHGFFCDSTKAVIDSDIYNPLALSGLALAGANRHLESDIDELLPPFNDGILLAIEVSNLNLIGTEVVTVSGCETGLGRLMTGEGVFGLRRAFQLAGAQSMIMSLWQVPDKETGVLMSEFYRYWLGGMSKQDALRESSLDILEDCRVKRGTGHPIFWGGFILIGNPN
jgi:CHAT domain-containing protein